jgi:voltage-gated sodium channel
MFALTLFSHSFFHSHAPTYFGDPLRSMYSMFQIFTVEGGYEIPSRIAKQASWPVGVFAKVYFAFVVLTGGILGLSLANAVFVDEMVVDNTKDLEDDVTELRKNRHHMETSKAQREELTALIADLRNQLKEAQSDEESPPPSEF